MEKNLLEHKDKIPEEVKEEVTKAVEACKAALESEDTEEIQSKVSELQVRNECCRLYSRTLITSWTSAYVVKKCSAYSIDHCASFNRIFDTVHSRRSDDVICPHYPGCDLNEDSPPSPLRFCFTDFWRDSLQIGSMWCDSWINPTVSSSRSHNHVVDLLCTVELHPGHVDDNSWNMTI